jgi:hypothetical protein
VNTNLRFAACNFICGRFWNVGEYGNMPVYMQEHDDQINQKILIFNIEGEWWLTASTLVDDTATVTWVAKGVPDSGGDQLNMCQLQWYFPWRSGYATTAVEAWTGHDYLNVHYQHQLEQVILLNKEIEAKDELNLKLDAQVTALEQELSTFKRVKPDEPYNSQLKHGWANKMVAMLGALQAGASDPVMELAELFLGWG